MAERELPSSSELRARFMRLSALRASSPTRPESTPPSMRQPVSGVQTNSARALDRKNAETTSAKTAPRRRIGVENMKDLPANQCTSVGQARPKRDEQGGVARADSAASSRLIERERNRGGGRVAVAVDIDEEAIERELEVLRDGIDDAQVGLVRDDAGDLI